MKKYLSIFLLSILIVSCKKQLEREITEISKNHRDSELVELALPNKVTIHKIEEGTIRYNLKLDTVEANEISNRYVFLHYSTFYPNHISFTQIKNGRSVILEDTLQSGEFNFKFDFNELGRGVFNAAIEDIIILKEKQNDGQVRILTTETVVSKEVLVEAPKNNNG